MNEHTIECPACHATGSYAMPAVADISSNPTLKDDLLNGSFFEWICPGCRRRFFTDATLLCCSEKDGYCVYLVPGNKEVSLPIPAEHKLRCSGILRVTSSFLDFSEKLRIFGAGLSDRIIEAMKAVYATVCRQTGQKAVRHMLFEAVKPDGGLGFTVMTEDERRSVSLPAAAYTHAMADFDTLLPKDTGDHFVRVDQQWLASALNGDVHA